jgi:hypothetical protein
MGNRHRWILGNLRGQHPGRPGYYEAVQNPYTNGSINLIREFKNLKWKEDQAGKATN